MVGRRLGATTSLFIDHLPRDISPEWVHDLFSEYGKVVDVFVSKKIRKGCKDAFGFVRFKRIKDAKEAINKLNGHGIKNMKMSVALARYGKDGRAVTHEYVDSGQKKQNTVKNRVRYPSLRASRKYSEVVRGTHKPTVQKAEQKNSSGQVSLELLENPFMVSKLDLAVVVDLEPPYYIDDAVASLNESELDIVCISVITPSKIALFFENEGDMKMALDEESSLRKKFADVRR